MCANSKAQISYSQRAKQITKPTQSRTSGALSFKDVRANERAYELCMRIALELDSTRDTLLTTIEPKYLLH